MNTTLKALTIGLSLLGGALPAAARPHGDFVDSAKVISATPIYETVRVSRPVEECWTEEVVRPGRRHHQSYTGTLAGGIIGGVIGNQFGHGDGKAAMTVAGTLLGASIGHDISRRQGRYAYVTHERRCELVDEYRHEEQLVGYRVKYRYKGQTFVTRTDEHPGRRIRVQVAVNPLEAPEDRYHHGDRHHGWNAWDD